MKFLKLLSFILKNESGESNVLNFKVLKNKKCLVIVPTRERVEKFRQMYESFKKTTSPDTGLIACIDFDDPKKLEYQKYFGTEICYVIGKRRPTTQIYNYVANQLMPGFKYYSPSNDDFEYLTAIWDVKLMTNIEEHDGWGISYGDDRIQSENMCTTSVISGNIVRALGWLQLPSLQHLYGDHVWKVIGRGLGRIYYDTNVIIRHRHPVDNETKPDAVFERTNSPQMYAVDRDSFDRWFKHHAKKDLGKIMREIFKEVNFNKTVSVCMIIGQHENPMTLRRCIKSFDGWAEEVCAYINWTNFANPFKVKILADMIKNTSSCPVKIKTGPFKNFSYARNISLKMAEKDFCLWLDVDDELDLPHTVKDIIYRYPNYDVFQCHVISYNEMKGNEHISQSRLLRNTDYMEFRNAVHEDCSFAYSEHKAQFIGTDIVIHHTGNTSRKKVRRKNMRNYRLTLSEINKPDAHSLTYFAIVNELMLMKDKRKKNCIEAIGWIDKYFDKFPDNGKDPIVPKMWILRGACALDCGQVMAAQTNFMKAWEGWKHPEAGIMLGECDVRNGAYDKAIKILEEIYETKEFKVCNIPIDMETIELSLLRKLGEAYEKKAASILALKKADPKLYNEEAYKLYQGCIDKAEKYFSEFLSIDARDEFVCDRMAEIYRIKGQLNDANAITVSMVNMFRNYWIGWKNLGAFELMNKRYRTAEVFYREAMVRNPNDKEVKHNLKMIKNILKGKAKDNKRMLM